VNMQGKTRRFGRFTGVRPDWRKAYVRLAAGERPSSSSTRCRGEAHGTEILQADSAGRALMTRLDFAEITKDRPEKSLTRGIGKSGGRNNEGHETCPLPWRRAQAPAMGDRLPARQARHSGPGSQRSSTTPTARRTSRCCTTSTVRSATSWRPTASRSTRRSWLREGRDHSRQRVAAEEHPAWCDGSQHRAQAGVRRSACSRRRRQRPVMAKEGKYVTLRMPSGEMRLVLAACWRRLARLATSTLERLDRQAGRIRWMGRRGHVRGHRDEPDRPSARWWRGQDQGGRHR